MADDKRVLVVEDDEDLRFSIGDILMDYNYKVKLAENGAVALRALRDDGGEFDLMLLDVQMPVMNGLSLLDALIEAELWLPTIIMTGFGDKNLIREINRRGRVVRIDKPFSLNEMLVAVKRCLAQNKWRNGYEED